MRRASQPLSFEFTVRTLTASEFRQPFQERQGITSDQSFVKNGRSNSQGNTMPIVQKLSARLTADCARFLFNYEPETGIFTRRDHPHRTVGALSDGYLLFKVSGRTYRAHRVAWLYMYGQWPADQIDHINGDRADNRIANLRACSNAVNMQNQRNATAKSKTGILGVSFIKQKRKPHRWRAHIKVNKKDIFLGTFESAQEARDAYLIAKRRFHPGCTI